MTVQQIAGRVAAPGSPGASPAVRGPAFADVLARASEPDLTLSAHAADRLRQHGIEMPEAVRQRIAEALDVLAQKGARDAVLVAPEAAFVVNVPNRTVVTALAPSEMRDRAITQIDSALLL